VLCVWVVFPAHVTVVLPSQSSAVTITWNMDPSVAATKTNWYNGGTTVTFGAEYGPTVTFGEESGLWSFTFPPVAITVDAYGAATFGVRIGLRCCIGLRSSTFLSLIFGRCCNYGRVTLSCRWTFSVILYVFPPHFRHSSLRQLLETLSNLSEFRHQFSELEHYIHSPTLFRFSSWSCDSISSS